MPGRAALPNLPLKRLPHRDPSAALHWLYLSYTTFTLSHAQESLEGVARGAGRSLGLASGHAAERRGGDGHVDSGPFSGRNDAYSHASENLAVECDFSAFCGALAL